MEFYNDESLVEKHQVCCRFSVNLAAVLGGPLETVLHVEGDEQAAVLRAQPMKIQMWWGVGSLKTQQNERD